MAKPTVRWISYAAVLTGTACGGPETLLSEPQHFRSAVALSELDTANEGASARGVIHPAGHDDLCLDVVWGNNKDGTPVQISKCNGNEAQLWTATGGMLKAYGNKCLNVADGDEHTGNGARLHIWTCDGETTQDKNNLWKLQDGTVRWQRNTQLCLDVMSGRFASGTPAQLWTCGGSKGNVNQRWTTPQPSGTNTPATPTPTPTLMPTPTPNPTPAPAPSSGGLKSTTPGFEAGMHVDYDNASGKSGGLGGFVQRTQIKPKLVANYVRIKKDGSFESGGAKNYADDAANHGAKIISYAITVEPVTLKQGQIDAVVAAVHYAQSKGLKVELRFGYEMNGYWSPPLYDKNSPDVYKKAWAQLAPAARAAGAAMVWSPNVAGGAPDVYKSWLPYDLTSVDKVGLDYYLNPAQGSQPTVAQVKSILSGIYPVVQQINDAHKRAGTGREVPFTFGETAVTIRDDRNNWGKSVGSETEVKRKWLVALADSELRKTYPLYRGFTWFDYYKTEPSGGTTGKTYSNAFELSQDPGSADMFRAWYQAQGL